MWGHLENERNMETRNCSKANYLEVSVLQLLNFIIVFSFLFFSFYIRKLISSYLVKVACYQATALDAHVES
ncbi:hypothetical protein ABKV19_008578 [Rosa sericea]